jgi:hypothetical protein
MIDRIEHEPRAHLRWSLVQTLQVMTGQKHRQDPRPWRLFASQLPESWHASEVVPAPEEAAAVAGATSSSFAGLPIRSDRICFLIDFSGSLWQEREGGRTRKELVDEQLTGVLPALAEETEFNLMPYTGLPIPWQKSLVRASSVTVKQALGFFTGCHATGRGNFYDAALLAMADERVDTICVLTDGAPTGGHHWNLELMVNLLLERNRFRRIAFDSILVDASPGLEKHWQELARKSGGRSIVVSF